MFGRTFRLPTFVLLVIALGAQAPSLAARAQSAPPPSRDHRLFDFDWRFRAGDVTGAEAPAFDDGSWEKVDLPHDFMIEGKGQNIVVPGGRAAAAAGPPRCRPSRKGPFDPRSPGGNSNGYLNGGFGWYRKTFTLPEASRNRRVFVEFEGVYMNSEVWINGQSLGTRPYGYSTFEYDLTPHLRFGRDTNILAVRVNVQQPSSRWYSGAGIYRHVWLTETAPVHVAQWGTTVRTPSITDARASVEIQTTVRNDGRVACRCRSLKRPSSIAMAEPSVGPRAGATVAGGAASSVTTTVAVDRPHRWSIDDPYLYSVVTRVRLDAGTRRGRHATSMKPARRSASAPSSSSRPRA